MTIIKGGNKYMVGWAIAYVNFEKNKKFTCKFNPTHFTHQLILAQGRLYSWFRPLCQWRSMEKLSNGHMITQ